MRISDGIKGRLLGNSHDKQISESAHDEITLWLYRKLQSDRGLIKLVTGTSYQKLIVKKSERHLEYPLHKLNYRSFQIAGFADIAVEATIEEIDDRENDNGEIEEHKSLVWQFGFIEVKSEINVGETIRQINYYKTLFIHSNGSREKADRWSICAPASPYQKIFEEQNINFIPYEPDNV